MMLDFVTQAGRIAAEQKEAPTQQFYPYPGRAVEPSWGLESLLRKGRGSSTVAAAEGMIARAGSSVPWIVRRRQAGGVWEQVDGHELEILLEYPQGNEQRAFYTRKRLIEEALRRLVRRGNALFRKVLVRGRVDTLWPLNPANVKPVPGRDEWLDHYEVTEGNRKYKLQPDDVIHAQIPDPDSPLWGASPLEAVRRQIEADSDLLDWQRNLARQGGLPPLAFFAEVATKEQRKEVDDALAAKLSGTSTPRWITIPKGQGDVKQLSQTAQEMDYLESRKHLGAEVALVLGTLAALFADRAMTYENLRTAIRFMWENGTIPLLDILADAFNLSLVPRSERRKTWITYDLSGVKALQDDLAARMEVYAQAVANAVPPDKAAEIAGLAIEDLPEEGFIDGRLLPVSQVVSGGLEP